jgi:hypothetical protein
VQDKYPAYISWATYEQIQTMLTENYAEYDRNKTRGVPRPGKALLHGLVYCGACGHKMVVQYKGGTQYLCNALRQQYGVPVCQRVPADPVDSRVVAAFFEALSSVELDVYTHAIAARQQQADQLAQAYQQQLERLRYEAAWCERQFRRVDPDYRLVAAELERRWEMALRDLKAAEAAAAHRAQHQPSVVEQLPAALREAFIDIGRKLPDLWATEGLSQPQRKALLRCLIDKVVIQRLRRDTVHTRMIWKGGATTTYEVPVSVGAFADLSTAVEMEQQMLTLCTTGRSDEAIAEQLTQRGYRSPQRLQVLPSTVKTLRLKHGLMQKPSQSHPRRKAGYLTIPQLAQVLGVSRQWLHDRMHNGRIQVCKDPSKGVYLFPDHPTTVEQRQQLQAGTRVQVSFMAPQHPVDGARPPALANSERA